MERHYIHDYSRSDLIKFHGGETTNKSTEVIREECIEQLCADSDADNYILVDKVLFINNINN